MVIRPLQPGDVGAAADLAVGALPDADGADDERRAWMRRRIGRLQRADPDGAWLAEDGGEPVGVGLALVRDGIWGLSLLAVRPERQARGAGGALLDACLRTAAGARGGIIASSTDPKAMRLYARAGFELRPCVALGGLVDRSALPTGLRAAESDDDEQAAALAGPVRGGAYDPEDLRALHEGMDLLLIPGRGFAIHRDGSPVLLCAHDDGSAVDLLWSCLAAAPPGATVNVDFLTAGQDWAIRTGLAAGLLLSPDGPVFTRGRLGPLRPWIPSGALL